MLNTKQIEYISNLFTRLTLFSGVGEIRLWRSKERIHLREFRYVCQVAAHARDHETYDGPSVQSTTVPSAVEVRRGS